MTHEPALAQCWNAGNDVNGNPRRVWLIYSAEGRVLDAIDEGYAGLPGWANQLPHLPAARCKVREYRGWLKSAGASRA